MAVRRLNESLYQIMQDGDWNSFDEDRRKYRQIMNIIDRYTGNVFNSSDLCYYAVLGLLRNHYDEFEVAEILRALRDNGTLSYVPDDSDIRDIIEEVHDENFW